MRSCLSIAILLSGCGLLTDLDPRPDASGVDAGFDAATSTEDSGPAQTDGATPEAAVTDASACTEEVCNGLDDDCDGLVDECDVPNAAAVCSAGACEIEACNPGFEDCNDDVTDGCEADLTRDVTNCGVCGAGCTDTRCVRGTCSDPAQTSARALSTPARAPRPGTSTAGGATARARSASGPG